MVNAAQANNAVLTKSGIDYGVMANWREARAGQGLTPRFGSRPFPKMPIFAFLFIGSYFAYGFEKSDKTISLLGVLAIVAFIALACAVLIVRDRLSRRRISIHADCIYITHGRGRTMLPKSQLKQVFLYRTKIPSMVALELVTVKRVSTVLGMPSELVTPGLIARLRDSGFDVSSEL